MNLPSIKKVYDGPVTNTPTNSNPYVQLFLSVFLGSVVGGLTYLFVKALESINSAHGELNSNTPFHLALAPLVLGLIILIRRRTLYFPQKIKDLNLEVTSHYWSSVMAPFHFIAPLLGHAAGMSLGREGAVVLFSSGLARVLKLSFSFWGPVLASIGFSSIIGNYWVAPVFMFELFPRTTAVQKLCAFLGGFAAVIAGQQLGVPHLFLPFEVKDESGFFTKFGLFLLLGAGAGYIMRYYKKLHSLLEAQLKNSIAIQLLLSVVVAAFLYLPEFRMYQSLSLTKIHDLPAADTSLIYGLVKLAFTLVCTSLPFLGGEFIPLVFAGVNLGGAIFKGMGADPVLGAAAGAFILFAAGSRLKWTAFFLMTSLLGFGWMLWIFFVLTIALNFAGEDSLYKKISH
jgi:H+/Cl- antiporter ClcA